MWLFNRLLLFIDWKLSISTPLNMFEMREMYRDVTDTFYWVALP